MTTNEPPHQPDGSTPPLDEPPAPAVAGPTAAPVTNKKAVWSMGLGLVSLVVGYFMAVMLVGSITAIVLGFLARGEIRRSEGTQTGAGQAVVGIVTGGALVVLLLVAIVLVSTGLVEVDLDRAG